MQSDGIFLKAKGAVTGPFTLDELRLQAQRRTLNPSHELSYDGVAWFSASKIWTDLARRPPSTAGTTAVPPTSPAPASGVVDAAHEARRPVREETSRTGVVRPTPYAVLVILFIVLELGLIPFEISEAHSLLMTQDSHAQQEIAPRIELYLSQDKYGTVSTAVSLTKVLVFFLWLFRCSRNLHNAGVGGLRFQPWECVVWFFVPIFNFWMPFRVMHEIWRTSEMLAVAKGAAERSGLMLGLWWIFTLATAIGSLQTRAYFKYYVMGRGARGTGGTLIGYLNNYWFFTVILTIVSVVALITTALLVYQITSNQRTWLSRRAESAA